MTRRQTRHLKKAFLDAFRQHGNITRACQQSGVPHRTEVYRWQEHDEEFSQEFKQAEIEATEHLEAEAHRRAVEGVTKEKGIYHNGRLIDTYIEIDYSDTLLIFLLKARAPEKYRDRHDITSGGKPLAAHADLDADIERQLARLVAGTEGTGTLAPGHDGAAQSEDTRR